MGRAARHMNEMWGVDFGKECDNQRFVDAVLWADAITDARVAMDGRVVDTSIVVGGVVKWRAFRPECTPDKSTGAGAGAGAGVSRTGYAVKAFGLEMFGELQSGGLRAQSGPDLLWTNVPAWEDVVDLIDPVCIVCHGPGVSTCAECFTPYCGPDCQKLDWKFVHSRVCKAKLVTTQGGVEVGKSVGPRFGKWATVWPALLGARRACDRQWELMIDVCFAAYIRETRRPPGGGPGVCMTCPLDVQSCKCETPVIVSRCAVEGFRTNAGHVLICPGRGVIRLNAALGILLNDSACAHYMHGIPLVCEMVQVSKELYAMREDNGVFVGNVELCAVRMVERFLAEVQTRRHPLCSDTSGARVERVTPESQFWTGVSTFWASMMSASGWPNILVEVTVSLVGAPAVVLLVAAKDNLFSRENKCLCGVDQGDRPSDLKQMMVVDMLKRLTHLWK